MSTGSKCNLEISWGGPAADGEGDLVVKEVDDQVQVDRLLPVHIGVTNWKLSSVDFSCDFETRTSSLL